MLERISTKNIKVTLWSSPKQLETELSFIFEKISNKGINMCNFQTNENEPVFTPEFKSGQNIRVETVCVKLAAG